MAELIKPTIHLNGTSPQALYDQNSKALRALYAAIRDLEDAAPNARDYYLQGPKAFDAARHEHERRVRRLVEVRKELEELQEHLSEFL